MRRVQRDRAGRTSDWWEGLSLDPEVRIEVTEHAVGSGPGRTATSYTTRGLAAHGQPEVIFTWAGPAWLPAPSRAVSAALVAVAREVEAGFFRPSPGRCIRLVEVSFIDIGMSGFLLVPAQPLRGFTPAAGSLHAIALTEEELKIATGISPQRVTARLGLLAGYFPYPPWTSPRRSVARPGEVTVLASTPRAEVPGLAVHLEDTTLSVRVPRWNAPLLGIALTAVGEQGIAMITEPSLDADAHLVWTPGAAAATAFIRPHSEGRRIAGGFLRVAAGTALRIGVLEDGYSLVLAGDSRDALRAAMAAGRDWSSAADDGSVQVRIV